MSTLLLTSTMGARGDLTTMKYIDIAKKGKIAIGENTIGIVIGKNNANCGKFCLLR
jgi:hypothetical protein